MAAFAYVLLPITGLLAYLRGSTPRMRFHGLQAIALGAAWPALLYVATWTTPAVTQIVFAAGVLMWVFLVVGAALGRDWHLPLVGRRLETAATESPPTDGAEASMR